MRAEDQLLGIGLDRVETFSEAQDALEYLVKTRPFFAILDFRLARGETSLDVARRLIDLAVPFVFATGLGEVWAAPEEFQQIPVLIKPLEMVEVSEFLVRFPE